MPALGQRLADGADDQAAHQPGIAKAYIGLGRMDIDVDIGRVERQKSTASGWRSRGSTSAKAPRIAPAISLSRTGRPLT